MSGRKKRGIGFFISGAVFIVAGLVSMQMDLDPAWLSQAVVLVGLVADFWGFKTVFPDTD